MIWSPFCTLWPCELDLWPFDVLFIDILWCTVYVPSLVISFSRTGFIVRINRQTRISYTDATKRLIHATTVGVFKTILNFKRVLHKRGVNIRFRSAIWLSGGLNWWVKSPVWSFIVYRSSIVPNNSTSHIKRLINITLFSCILYR